MNWQIGKYLDLGTIVGVYVLRFGNDKLGRKGVKLGKYMLYDSWLLFPHLKA